MKKLKPSPVPYQEFARISAGTPDHNSKYNYKVHKTHIRKSYERSKKQLKGLNSYRKYSGASTTSSLLSKSPETNGISRNFIIENMQNPCLKSYDHLSVSQKLYDHENSKTLGK